MSYSYRSVRPILPEAMMLAAKIYKIAIGLFAVKSTNRHYISRVLHFTTFFAGSNEGDFTLHGQSFSKHFVFNTLFLRNEHGDHPIFWIF